MSFAWKKTCTIDHTKCGSSDSSNFPVLVSVTDTDLKTVGNSGFVQNANGYDIYFYSDAALTTRIPAERERYISTTGEIVFHVKVGTLSHTVDTVIYAAFGDAGISTDPNTDGTYGATSVWDSNFKGVYHLPDGTTLGALDSTSNANNGTLVNTPTAGAGQIDGAAVLASASAQSITLPNLGIGGTGGRSISFWVNPTSASAINALFSYGGFANDINFSILYNVNTKDIYVSFYNDDWNTSNNACPLSAWTFVEVVFDGGTASSSTVHIYINGIAQTLTYAGAFTAPNTTNSAYAIGIQPTLTTRKFDGSIDEVRVSASSRSADWITTEYNNQSSPSTFITWGSKIALSPSMASWFRPDPMPPQSNQIIQC